MTTKTQKKYGPKCPQVTVKLVGENSNAYAILGLVQRAMKREGLIKEWEEYKNEAMSGDYEHLLETTIKWVNVE
jgi:hypothetical protein